MKNYVTILAGIIFTLTLFGVEASSASSLNRCQMDLRKCNNTKDKSLKFKNCPIIFGQSKDAFKNNLPQDYCSIFRKGGPRAGQLGQANGKQIFTGICSNTPQGEIPKADKMPSTLIISPGEGQNFKRNKAFEIKVLTNNLELGFFSDPVAQYNAFPQELNKKGLIKGHQHVTIQFLGDKKIKIPDANIFAFFKGLNDPSKNGILEVAVEKGLPEKGLYRICTIISSFSHQPVILPKAQRGASDDCVRIRVV